MFGPLLLWGFSVVVKGLGLCASVCVCCLYLCGVYPHLPDPVENEPCYRAPCGAHSRWWQCENQQCMNKRKKSKLCYFCKLLVLKLAFCVRLQLLRMYWVKFRADAISHFIIWTSVQTVSLEKLVWGYHYLVLQHWNMSSSQRLSFISYVFCAL